MAIKDIILPDTGSSAPVAVLEIHVKVGDVITMGQTLVTLESDKATIDVPADVAGKVTDVLVKPQGKVQSGDVIFKVETAAQEPSTPSPAAKEDTKIKAEKTAETAKPKSQTAASAKSMTVNLPDTGSNAPVTIIELLVKAGDMVEQNQTLMTLESDKATIDVPAPHAGTIEKVLVKQGGKVNTGDAIVELKTSGEPSAAEETKAELKATETPAQATPAPKAAAPEVPKAQEPVSVADSSDEDIYTSPSIRRLARILGVQLNKVKGTGQRGRITKDDLYAFVKGALSNAQTGGSGMGLPQMPAIDFSQWGPVDVKPLLRIKKISAQNLSRNWLLAPHVTQFEEADITSLEAFRKSRTAEFEKQGLKLTPLVFIMKAVVNALKQFPAFNASLDETGENLVFKHYYHIGIAVDTPDGLVVPVIRDVDKKSVTDLAKELADVSAKARAKQLTAKDMQGSTFTISSLGGIGGTAFTPIINLPNVAILGVSKSTIKPQWDGQEFQPRLMLPLSLSYDHRVIDGAEAARFSVFLANQLKSLGMLDL